MFIRALIRPKVADIKRKKRNNSNVKFIPSTPTTRRRSFFPKAVIILFLSCLLFPVLQLNVNAPSFFYSSQVQALYDKERAELEKQLKQIEAEIAQYEKILATTKRQKVTLQNKIKELKSKAAKLSLQIKSTNLNLNYLNNQIDDTTVSISKTLEKINRTKENLADSLVVLYQLRQKPVIEILLANNEISEFFDYLNALNRIQEKIQDNIKELRELKVTLDKQKEKLESDKEETQRLLTIQILQKKELEQTKKEKSYLLAITKGNEARYQQMLADSRRRANEIRKRIYELIGVKTQVTFGEALDIAEWVSSKIPIRPAFLLAIITQESNLGKNVGTCNRPGDPYSKSWRVVMKPSRDQQPFLQICRELGLDPNITPVSCPMRDRRGRQVGWGGAMGPAQFIPSTWMRYKDRVSKITGKSPANPWDVRDAFVAAALYLTDYGAGKKTRTAEWRAAMIYFSGSTNPRYRFYGDSVMAIADRYERDIATLKQVASR